MEICSRLLPKGHFESPLSGSINQPNSVKKKSSNRRVQFGNVVLFKFGLAQGVDTVPTAGSISLGTFLYNLSSFNDLKGWNKNITQNTHSDWMNMPFTKM
jgi:hypothetical protein